jgi:sulfite exporter TauE/SafE
MEAFAAAAFTAGLLGGVHCIGMCGGVAGALAATARGPAWRRVAAFNAGRIASYSVAGAAAGSVGALAAAGPVQAAQLVLFVTAHGFLLLLGLYVAGFSSGLPRLEAAGAGVWSRLEPLRRRVMPIDNDARALAAGAVWGWLPCGMVYAMLPLAMASGSPLSGAAILAAFGLGTLPGLLAAGMAAVRLNALRRNVWVRRIAGLVLVALAIAAFLRLPALRELAAFAAACIGG